jgi:hypothetical protein
MKITLSAIEGVIELIYQECTRLLHHSQAAKFKSSSLGNSIDPSTNLNLFFVASALRIFNAQPW